MFAYALEVVRNAVTQILAKMYLRHKADVDAAKSQEVGTQPIEVLAPTHAELNSDA